MVEDTKGYKLTLVRCWRKVYQTYWLGSSLSEANNRRSFWSRGAGKGARQLLICNLSRGMLGCALLHLWQRNSIDKMSSSFNVARANLSISSITSTELRKKAVLKEFQCFLFLRYFELKSWLITWRCNCRIDGTCKKCSKSYQQKQLLGCSFKTKIIRAEQITSSYTFRSPLDLRISNARISNSSKYESRTSGFQDQI